MANEKFDISFGVRKKVEGYYAECQMPHGTIYSRKGPFATIEEAAFAAKELANALEKKMEGQVKHTSYTLEEAYNKYGKKGT